MPDQKRIRSPGNDIYSTKFSDYLPGALKKDPKIKSLAEAVTEQLLEVSDSMELVLIYSRIDELPEDLVDILAYDMHIDWYDYSYPLEAKRDILKNSIKVHKKMGTKYAVEKALGALYPESEVEEWFQYGGQPHHFRVICDVSKNQIQASYQDIANAVKMYKRLSSHMEEVTYQSRIYCTIQTHADCFIYRTPLTGRLSAGTFPQRNVKGILHNGQIVIETDSEEFGYRTPAAGTIPGRNTIFRGTGAEISAETDSEGNIFTVPAAGTRPGRNILFRDSETRIEADTEKEVFLHEASVTGKEKAGTQPGRNTAFRSSDAQIEAETAFYTYGYRNTPTGKKRAGMEPERSVRGANDSRQVEGTVKAEVFHHESKLCGSKRRL